MAVYTSLTLEEARKHIGLHYAIGEPTALKEIAEGVENSNFLLNTLSQRYILTLYEKRVHAEDLPFFIGLMDHLSARGIPCPQPVHGANGQAVYPLKGKLSCIVTFLEGRSVKSFQAAHCLALGQTLARMHLSAAGFPLSRPNALGLKGMERLAHSLQMPVSSGISQVEIMEELAYLQKHWPDDLPRGVIHADLFPDNVFFAPQDPVRLSGLIDFYFACNDLWMYDLAICLNAWCFERTHAFNITRAGALLRGYHSVRPIAQAELEQLPILARAASLRFLLTRAYDALNPAPGALVTPKDPAEYIKKLRFHQQVRTHSEYGFSCQFATYSS